MTFADLFSGIGGFRLALESLGLTCVLSCENDKYSNQTYEANFPRTPEHVHVDDIKELAGQPDLPHVDIVTAGFPCQPFSGSGLRKGTSDEKGMLFWDMAEAINTMRPKAFILENVPGLLSLNRGAVYQSMMDTLTNELGYFVHMEIMNSRPFVPQKRRRMFFVGFQTFKMFAFPICNSTHKPPILGDIIEPQTDKELMLTSSQWESAKKNKANFLEKHGTPYSSFFMQVYNAEDCSRTLTTNTRNSRKVLYAEPGWERPRFFSVREIARMMGFPDSFEFPVSDTQAYKQLGNAVVPAVVELLAKQVIKHL